MRLLGNQNNGPAVTVPNFYGVTYSTKVYTTSASVRVDPVVNEVPINNRDAKRASVASEDHRL